VSGREVMLGAEETLSAEETEEEGEGQGIGAEIIGPAAEALMCSGDGSGEGNGEELAVDEGREEEDEVDWSTEGGWLGEEAPVPAADASGDTGSVFSVSESLEASVPEIALSGSPFDAC